MRRASLAARIAAFEQLARLLSAGIPLSYAIDRLAAGVSQPGLRVPLNAIRASIAAGTSLHAAVRGTAGLLSEAECALIEVGEQTGHLPEVIERIAAGWRRSLATRRALLAGIAYPAFLLLASAFLLPLPELVARGTGAYARSVASWLGGAAAIIGLAVIAPRVLQRLGAGPAARAVAWRTPVVASLYRRRVIGDVLHALATALAAGLGIPKALDLSARAGGDETVASGMAAAGRAIAAGGDLAGSLRATGLFPEVVCIAVAGGEQSGTLADTLARLADDIAREHESLLKLLTRMATAGILLAVVASLGVRVLGQARALLPGAGGEMDEVMQMIEREAPVLRPLR